MSVNVWAFSGLDNGCEEPSCMESVETVTMATKLPDAEMTDSSESESDSAASSESV